jgi:hypothetical protein
MRPPDGEAAALERTAIQVLEREACPLLLAKTFALEESAATTGKLWVRSCSAQVEADQLAVDVDVLGWQWVAAGSWGFDVDEYVYFRAAVHGAIRAAIEVDRDRPRLRLWSDVTPRVEVKEIGRVSARSSNPAASLLGMGAAILGQGPNVLATSALRSRVRSAVQDRALEGILVALAPARISGVSAPDDEALLDEREVLHPGGALISGSFPGGMRARLAFQVENGRAALARAVCIDEAATLVDSVVAGAAPPPRESPSGVVVLQGSGQTELSPPDCPWVLVTGARADDAVSVHLTLVPTREPASAAPARWVRVTVLAYEVTGADKEKLLAIRVGSRDASKPLGHPLTSARSPALWLVSDPIEVANGVPVIVGVDALSPRTRRSWWEGVSYEERPIGRAAIVPRPGVGHQEVRAPLEASDHAAGWVDLALDAVEVR